MTPLFVELCAGTAALSLRLQGGNRCRPVVSRMGAKTGYANVILACFGLTPGGKAGAYLWCEPDPGARLLLQALPQPEVLREAASVLRGWASEDPRTLWEALRKEGPPKGCDGREVARWAQILGCTVDGLGGGRFVGWTSPESAAAMARMGASYINSLEAKYGRDAQGRILCALGSHPNVMSPRMLTLPSLPPTTITEDARTVDPREVARLLLTGVWSYKQGMPESGFIGPGQRRQDTTATATATATAQIADLCGGVNAEIVADARGVDPREVARQILRGVWSYEQGNTRTGFVGPGDRRQDTTATATATATATLALCASDWPPVAVTSDARKIDPPRLPEGTIAYLDGPYEQTTGYGNLLPRAEQVKLARLWADAGAFVGVSEQVPIPELMADGWHAVQITNGRKGAARTFSRQKSEWLTLSRPPVNAPLLGVQEGLF